MSSWVFLKTVADLSLYFSALSLAPTVFLHGYSYLWVIVLCGFGTGLAAVLSGMGKGGARFVGLLPIFSAVLLAQGVLEYLILAPALVYSTVAAVRGYMGVEYAQYRDSFRRIALIWGICFAAASMYYSFETVLMMQQPPIDIRGPFTYGLLYAIASVFLMRLLRMGQESSGSRMNNAQALALMAGGGGILLALTVAQRYMRGVGKELFWEIWSALMVALSVPVHLVGELIAAMLPKDNKGEYPTATVDPNATDPSIQGIPPGTQGTEPVPVEPQQEVFPWVFVVLVVLALAVVLVMLVSHYARQNKSVASQEVRSTLNPKAKQARRERHSNRYKMRGIYRDFLRSQRRRGAKLRGNQTSLDVLREAPKGTDRTAAETLRALYLPARYNPHAQVTKEDLDRAKQAEKSCSQ